MTATAPSLNDRLDRIESMLSEAATKPAFHRGNDSMSYIEGEQVYQVGEGSPYMLQRRRKAMLRPLPAGYKHGVWKSMGDFLREGVYVHNPDAGKKATLSMHDFHGKYQTVWKAVQGMSEGVGGDGGFAVLPEYAPNIYDRVYANDIWSRTDQYTVTGNRMVFPRNAETNRATGSRAGGLRAYWVDEGGTITSSKPKLAETELRLKKLAVVVYLTQELLDDNAYALEQYVTRKVAEEFNFMTGNSVFNGNGAGQPLGFLSASCGAAIEVSKEDDQQADTLVPQNLVKMFERRLSTANPQDYVWFINQSVEPQLHLLSLGIGTGGAVVYMPPNGLSAAPFGTLLGREIVPVEFCPALGDAGDVNLVNLKEYCTISKGGVSEAVSTHVEFLTDQLALRFTMRIDGKPYEESPITPFAAGATTPPTQSAFIKLAARA